MPHAAVPKYLRDRDFSNASPGLRFGMYLPLWGVEGSTGEMLWTTHDVNYRVSGRNRERRSFNDSNKEGALRNSIALTSRDREMMAALHDRQSALARPLLLSRQLLSLTARAVSPFTTGLGIQHPLENGFAFLNPYGLPYLPGSGVKGVLRQAARELAGLVDHAKWDNESGWDAGSIDALFGNEAKDGADHQRGALTFWDVIPQVDGSTLQVEVMTVHQKHYYQENRSPHESGQPIPNNFLTVPPGSGFTFFIQCNRPFLQRFRPDLVQDDRWQGLLRDACMHAFDWLGFGAKTAVGYGAMAHDHVREEAARRRHEELEAEERAAAENARKQAEQEALRAQMTPVERSIHEYLDDRPDKNQAEISAVIGEVKKGRWQGEDKVAVARWLEQQMRSTQGQWKESSKAKRPEKDRAYQNTLLVKEWLAGR